MGSKGRKGKKIMSGMEKKKIKVSVIIYVRNDYCHIEKCIRSVLNQTLREIEILIIDGGSTDGTKELAEKIASEDYRVRVISSKPGVGAQFNLGLQEAKGEYIGICESDDYLLPGMYQEEYETAVQYRLDIVRADFNRFFEIGRKEIAFPVSIADSPALYHCVINPKKDRSILRAGSQGFWSGLYRREFLLEQGITMNETPGASYQDMGFAFLSTIHAERIMLLKRTFYCYRMDNPNSSENSPKKLTMVTDEYQLLKERLLKENLFEEYKEWYFFWKVNGMLWFYNRLSGKIKTEYASLMYHEINCELKLTGYSGSELSFACREIVSKVKESHHALLTYLQQVNQDLLKMEQEINGIHTSQVVVIFGNGNMGRLLRCYMEYHGKILAAYIDNNQNLWGTIEDKVPVIAPEDAVKLYPDAIYVIANINAYYEIKQQLLDLEIKEENIVICNNYEKILVCLQKSVMGENSVNGINEHICKEKTELN